MRASEHFGRVRHCREAGRPHRGTLRRRRRETHKHRETGDQNIDDELVQVAASTEGVFERDA
jgi:hypothetical protein